MGSPIDQEGMPAMVNIPEGINYTIDRTPQSETRLIFFGSGLMIEALQQAANEGRVTIPTEPITKL